MGVQTGETITLSTDVYLEYSCTQCGHENLLKHKLTGSGYTGVLFGKRLNSSYYDEARQNLNDNLEAMAKTDPAQWCQTQGFTCRCEKCGHREPWARLTFKGMKKLRTWMLWGLFIIPVFVGAATPPGQGNPGLWIGLALLFAILGMEVYKVKKRNHLIREIESAPLSALPRLTPKRPVVKKPTYSGTWTCSFCGGANSHSVYTCGHCGRGKT